MQGTPITTLQLRPALVCYPGGRKRGPIRVADERCSRLTTESVRPYPTPKFPTESIEQIVPRRCTICLELVRRARAGQEACLKIRVAPPVAGLASSLFRSSARLIRCR